MTFQYSPQFFATTTSMSPLVGSNLVGQVHSFSSLPVGWNYGRGSPASGASVNKAISVLALLSQFGSEEQEVFPLTGGGVMVSAYYGSDAVNVSIRNDGLFNLYCESSGEETRDDVGVEWQVILDFLRELKWHLKTLYALRIPASSASGKVASKAKYLKLPTTGRLWLMPIALPQQMTRFASTSPSTTLREYRGILWFSSVSLLPFSRPEVRSVPTAPSGIPVTVS